MKPVANRLMAVANQAAWVYRRTGGRIGGSATGALIPLITVPERKTGVPRSVPVAFFEHCGGCLVGGVGRRSKGRRWIHNLRAAGRHTSVSMGASSTSTLGSHTALSATLTGGCPGPGTILRQIRGGEVGSDDPARSIDNTLATG